MMGAYLVWAVGWPVLALGAFGALTGFCYSATPLKLGSRGWGELFIMLDFGVLPVLGAYYVQAEAFTWPALGKVAQSHDFPATQYSFAFVRMNNWPCDTAIVERVLSSPGSPIGIVWSSLPSSASTTKTTPAKSIM